MQTLTSPTIFPCYAAADRAIAERLAALLERGADVRVFLDEGQLAEGADLAEKAREARMADIVLVLFSRNSLASRWPRTQRFTSRKRANHPPPNSPPTWKCSASRLPIVQARRPWRVSRWPVNSPAALAAISTRCYGSIALPARWPTWPAIWRGK